MKTTGSLAIFIFVLFISASCVKIQTLPPEPYIEYTSFEIFDTVILGNEAKGGRLKFYFEDGDGDLGLNPPADGQTADSTNIFLTLYRKSEGIMEPAPENDPLKPLGYRIPYMERPGQNKILKGTISVTFLYLFYFESDTISYDFYIKDRAAHESNVASTNEIIVSDNGIY